MITIWVTNADSFITALAATGNVSAACRAADVGRTQAYHRKAADPEFALAWDVALETATDALESEARRRALEGCERPVFYKGDECGRILEYSDTLMVFLLKAHRPGKFRDNVQHSHEGVVEVRVTYADRGDRPPPPPCGPVDDPGLV